MAGDWTDWADGNDLARMTRSTSPLADEGYDVDSLRMNPQQRVQAMDAMAQRYVMPQGAASRQNSSTIGAATTPTSSGAPGTGMRTSGSASGAAAMPSSTGTASATPAVAKPVASSTPAAATAVDPTSLDAAGREAIRQSELLGQAEAARAAKIAANPSPDTSGLEAKIESESNPTPYRDAAGKPLPEYAPTTMQKIGRGLKGAALGLFEGGPFGLGVGALAPGLVRGGTDYSDPNAAYDAAENARQAQLGEDTQSLANLRERWKDQVQSNKDTSSAVTGANTAFGNTVKGVGDLTPKGKGPSPYLIDGKPGFASFDPTNGWINETPGVNYGKPVTGSLAPYAADKTAPAGKPVQGTLNGHPAWGLYDTKNGWMNANPGPDFGKPMGQGWAPPPSFAETGMYEPVNVYDPNAQQFEPGQFNKRTGQTSVSATSGKPFAVPTSAMTQIDKAREAAREADTRLRVMTQNEADALKGNQQAMISLVANHIGMTLGQQKGARINQAVWDEAVQSAPWLQRAEARFGKDGVLSGVTLSPDQIRQMVDLAKQRRDLQWRQAAETGQQYGIPVNTPAGNNATPAAQGSFNWGAGFHPLNGGH